MSNKRPILVWLIAAYLIYQGATQLYVVLMGIGNAPLLLLLPFIGFSAVYLAAAVSLLLRIAISRLLIFAIFGYCVFVNAYSILNMSATVAQLSMLAWLEALAELLFLAFATFYAFKQGKPAYYQAAPQA